MFFCLLKAKVDYCCEYEHDIRFLFLTLHEMFLVWGWIYHVNMITKSYEFYIENSNNPNFFETSMILRPEIVFTFTRMLSDELRKNKQISTLIHSLSFSCPWFYNFLHVRLVIAMKFPIICTKYFSFNKTTSLWNIRLAMLIIEFAMIKNRIANILHFRRKMMSLICEWIWTLLFGRVSWNLLAIFTNV